MWRLSESVGPRFNKLGRWWNNEEEIDIVAIDSARRETYILFSVSGFTDRLRAMAAARGDLILFGQ